MRVLRHPVVIIVGLLMLIELLVHAGTSSWTKDDPLAGTRYASFVAHIDNTRPEGRFFDTAGLPPGSPALDAPVWLLGAVPSPGHGMDLATRIHQATGLPVVDMTQTDHVIDQTRVMFIEALRTGAKPRYALLLAGTPSLAAPVIGFPLHYERIQDILEARAGDHAMTRDVAAARVKSLVLLDHLLNRPSQEVRPAIHDALPFGLRRRGSAPEDAAALVRNLRLNRDILGSVCDDAGISCAIAWDPEVFRQDYQARFQELGLAPGLLDETGSLVADALAGDPEVGLILPQLTAVSPQVERLALAFGAFVGRAEP